jgi:acetoin utilization protein AcuB
MPHSHPKLSEAAVIQGPVVVTSPSETVSQAIERMRSKAIHHLVVIERGAVSGVVSDRDIFEKAIAPGGATLRADLTVADVMVPLADAVLEDTSLAQVLALMWSHRVSGLPVVRANGEVGIVTETDLLRALIRQLEEEAHPIDDAVARGQVALANPLVQSAMRLIAEAGI